MSVVSASMFFFHHSLGGDPLSRLVAVAEQNSSYATSTLAVAARELCLAQTALPVLDDRFFPLRLLRPLRHLDLFPYPARCLPGLLAQSVDARSLRVSRECRCQGRPRGSRAELRTLTAAAPADVVVPPETVQAHTQRQRVDLPALSPVAPTPACVPRPTLHDVKEYHLATGNTRVRLESRVATSFSAFGPRQAHIVVQ